MSRFDAFVRGLERRLNGTKSSPPTMLTGGDLYAEMVSALMIPRLREGRNLLQSWMAIEALLTSKGEIHHLTQKGFDNGFSDDFMKFAYRSYEEEEGSLMLLFKIFRRFQGSSPGFVADVLTIFTVDKTFDFASLSPEG